MISGRLIYLGKVNGDCTGRLLFLSRVIVVVVINKDMWVEHNGGWRKIEAIWVGVNSAWKSSDVFVGKNGVWE